MSEQEFVEVKVTVRVPRGVYDFLRDYYALSGRRVEEVLTTDFEGAVIDWTSEIIDEHDNSEAVLAKYNLEKGLGIAKVAEK